MQTLEQFIDEKIQPLIEQAIKRHESARQALLKRGRKKFPELPYECSPEYRKWFTSKFAYQWHLMQPKRKSTNAQAFCALATLAALGQ